MSEAVGLRHGGGRLAAGSRGCVASLTHLWASEKCVITVVTLDWLLFLIRVLSVGSKADSGR